MKIILILSANPKNTSPLRLGEETREIETALLLAKHRDNFKIITKWAVRVDDLRRALLNYQPHIVHFSGHGSGSTGLILEDNSGQVQLVTTASLARLFKSFQDSVECVLLNACYSEAQAQAIHQHIDYVIGMNRAIGDRAAIEFAIGFYDALGAGRPYENCFELGCASIDLEGIPESETPVLKARRRRNQTELETNLGGVVSGKSKTQQESNSQLRYGGISQSISGGTMYDGIQAAQGNQKQQTQETKVTASEEKPSQSFSISGGQVSNAQIGGQAGRDMNVTQNQLLDQGNSEKPLTQTDVVELIAQLEELFRNSELPETQTSNICQRYNTES